MGESTKERGEQLLKTLQQLDQRNTKCPTAFQRAREVLHEAEVLTTRKAVFWKGAEDKKAATEKFDVGEWEKARLQENSRRVGEFVAISGAITKELSTNINQHYDLVLSQKTVEQAKANEEKQSKEWLESKNQLDVQEMRAEVEKYKQILVNGLGDEGLEWDKLVATSRVVDQAWKKAPVETTVSLSPPKQELPPSGFLDTCPNHSFIDATSCSPIDVVQPTILENQIIILESETNKVLCTVEAEPGDSLATIRTRLVQISSEFRFLKPSGNPIALKMEGKTPLTPGQTSIVIDYVN